MSNDTRLVISKPKNCMAFLMLTHGAGAPMDSEFMTAITEALQKKNIGVIRFEFEYMAQRRYGGKKSPPPKMPLLIAEWHQQLLDLPPLNKPLFIGGKSMGGRVATLMNSASSNTSQMRSELEPDASFHDLWQGVICLGYPFHPQKKPLTLRTAHLGDSIKPVLIVQGTRDALGNQEEVKQYALSNPIKMHWIQTGNHDLKPLTSTRVTHKQAIDEAANAAHRFIAEVIKPLKA